jgi:hypothetical protein
MEGLHDQCARPPDPVHEIGADVTQPNGPAVDLDRLGGTVSDLVGLCGTAFVRPSLLAAMTPSGMTRMLAGSLLKCTVHETVELINCVTNETIRF